MVLNIFLLLTVQSEKNCKCIKIHVFMNLYGYVKTQSGMKIVFILLQSSLVWWNQEIPCPLAGMACPCCKCTELLSNIQKCIQILEHGHWSCKIFRMYPSSLVRSDQSVHAGSTRHQLVCGSVNLSASASGTAGRGGWVLALKLLL